MKLGWFGAALLVTAALGACKNVCEQAQARIRDCWEEACEDNASNPGCERLSDPMPQVECSENEAAAAEQVLRSGCEPLTVGLRNYVARTQSVEATVNVRAMARGARSYFEMEHVAPNGDLSWGVLPASAGRTPGTVPCGQTLAPDAALWQQPTWQALDFAVSEPFRYSYQFDSSGQGEGATFTASAFGDLDCDGFLSTFSVLGRAAGGEVVVGEVLSSQEDE